MFLIRENIPDALDLSAHLIAQKVLCLQTKSPEAQELLTSFARYMEYRYVGNYEDALYQLIDLGVALFGTPDRKVHFWLQLESLIEELLLSHDAVAGINKRVGVSWL